MAKTKKKDAVVEGTEVKIEGLKKQMFDLRLAKSISGVYDKKKMLELKKQVIALYASQK